MDKKTRTQLIKRLEKIERTLIRCEEDLNEIARIPRDIYLYVPSCTRAGFRQVYNGVDDMKRKLRGLPSILEG